MKERSEFRVKSRGVLVDVTEEVYYTYYRMARQANLATEKDEKHGVVSYDALDTDDLLGEETIPNMQSESVEDLAVRSLMCEKLHQCLDKLPESEFKLIHAVYFEGRSERQIAKDSGIPHMTIHDRKMKIQDKLKKLMENQK